VLLEIAGDAVVNDLVDHPGMLHGNQRLTADDRGLAGGADRGFGSNAASRGGRSASRSAAARLTASRQAGSADVSADISTADAGSGILTEDSAGRGLLTGVAGDGRLGGCALAGVLDAAHGRAGLSQHGAGGQGRQEREDKCTFHGNQSP
jgi:hypothetical protein